MLGIAANAGACTWGAIEAGAQDPDGETLATATAFLYLGEITTIDNGDGTYKLDFGSAQFITSVQAMDDAGCWGESVYSAARTHDDIEGEEQSYSYLLVNKAITQTAVEDKYEGNFFLYYGEEASYVLTDTDTGNTYSMLSYEDGQITSDLWSVAAQPTVTPEPTSGLLLLLGMAGLALRRRRA